MRSTTCIGVALAALSLGLAACGGDDPEPAAASDQEQVRDAAVKFSQCMRENGVENFPDPGANGELAIRVGPKSGIDPDEMEAASKACDQYRKDLRPEMSEEQQAEFKERALAHSRCMRERGIDFPDPQFSGGKVTMKIDKRSGIDPEDPDFQAAEEECREESGMGQGAP
jgi:hypothetical protein